MASVTVYSSDKMAELLDAGVVGASLVDGHLILEMRDGTTADVGEVLSGLPEATDTVKGIVELATDTETITGTDSVKVITPLALAALLASTTVKGLVELATNAETITGTDATRVVTPAGLKAAAQPLDADLTAIAALAGTNDNVIQRKSGAWTERTMAQLATDLMTTGEFPDIRLHNGTAYVDQDGTNVFVGPTDPGVMPNGTVWFDTTGT